MSKSIINFVTALIAAVGIAAACPASAGPVSGAGNAHHVTIWVPDYYGHNVFEYEFVTTGNQTHFTSTVRKLAGSGPGGQCSPNAVAVLNTDLYIVCNSIAGGADEVLVYTISPWRLAKRITGKGNDGHNYFTGSQLIAILFDSHKNLWVSGNATNDLLRVPSNALTTAHPEIDRRVKHSPDSPAGMAMDPDDHSIWVVGQYMGGIVVNFADSVLNAPGTYLGTALDATSGLCISNAALEGCKQKASLFNNPEGIAVFGNAIWVSNNGGNMPAKTIVRLVKDNKNGLTATTFGETASKPFACPGGMFAVAAPPGGKASLWVNDEGYDVTNTDCGYTSGDQGSHVGRVLEFLADDLPEQHPASPQPEQFTDWNKITTSSPGFGGIFVQMD
jgi:hypothetical protein